MDFSVDLDELLTAATITDRLSTDLAEATPASILPNDVVGASLDVPAQDQDLGSQPEDSEEPSVLAVFEAAMTSATETQQEATAQACQMLHSYRDRLVATARAYQETEDNQVKLIAAILEPELDGGIK